MATNVFVSQMATNAFKIVQHGSRKLMLSLQMASNEFKMFTMAGEMTEMTENDLKFKTLSRSLGTV